MSTARTDAPPYGYATVREIVWSEEARREYLGALRYLAPRNPHAALRLRDRIDAAVEDLAERPGGRRGRVEGTFEKIIPKFPYIVAYAMRATKRGGRIVILGVIHTSRDWLEGRWPEGSE